MLWKLIDRLLLPAAFFLIAFVVALTLWQLLIGHRRAEIQNATNEQAIFVKTKMESELRARVVPLEHLAGRGVDRAEVNGPAMEFDAKLVMSAYPAYQALEWVDPSYGVRWVTPQTQNEAELGADLGKDPRQLAALKAAEQTRSTIVTHTVNLKAGGQGILVCAPVFSNDQIAGFIVGVFRYKDLIPTILQNVAQGYWVAVYDGGEEIYRQGDVLAPRDSEWATRKTLIDKRLRGAGWRITPFDPTKTLESWDRCAVEEYQTGNGPADYALILGDRVVGVVERPSCPFVPSISPDQLSG